MASPKEGFQSRKTLSTVPTWAEYVRRLVALFPHPSADASHGAVALSWFASGRVNAITALPGGRGRLKPFLGPSGRGGPRPAVIWACETWPALPSAFGDHKVVGTIARCIRSQDAVESVSRRVCRRRWSDGRGADVRYKRK